jgi:hypothetical protein
MYVYYLYKYLLFQANKNRASSLKDLEVYYGTINTYILCKAQKLVCLWIGYSVNDIVIFMVFSDLNDFRCG